MRWIYWFILAYLALVLQAGLGPFIAWEGVPPNLVLIVVIFVALSAPREPALLSAFVMGLMQDLLTSDPLGFNAFLCGLIAWLAQLTQPVVYRDHPLTHFMLTLGATAVAAGLMLLIGSLHGAAPPVPVLITYCIYTAVLAPLLLWPLSRLRGLFAFQPPRRLK
jgi:rod shape-determining protein MreD